ncbi:zinc finger protein 521-like isoform X2 [Lineus longissimus]|uniref:zinc finger protein 521-like isoform X2 n=1 Tax=Lineus longissimus TaxID=88925 RepID=UPI00315DD457
MDEQVVTDGNSVGRRSDADASTLLNCTAKLPIKNNVDRSCEGDTDMSKITGGPELLKETDIDLNHSHFDHIVNGDMKNEHGTSNERNGIASCDSSNDIESGDTGQVSDELDCGVLPVEHSDILDCKDQPVVETSESVDVGIKVASDSSEAPDVKDKVVTKEEKVADLDEGSKESDIVSKETCAGETVDKEKDVAGPPVEKTEQNETVEKANEEVKMDVDDDLSRYLMGDANVIGDLVESLHEEYSTPTPMDSRTDELMYDSRYSQGTADMMTDELMYSQNSQGTAIYESDNSFKCQQCETWYNTSEEFQEHVVGHLVQNSLTADTMDDDGWSTCPICLVMFPEFSLYEEHLKNHLNNVNKCTVCNKTFSERKDLEDHVNKIHNVDRPFKCSECDKMFKSLSMLGAHLRKIHKKELSARCDFCTMSFLSQEDLDFHMRLKHAKKLKKSGKKRKRQYTCKVCSRIYFDRQGFELHKRKGHRPVSVNVPDASASTVSELNRAPILGPKLSSLGRNITLIPSGGHREISSVSSPIIGEAKMFLSAVEQVIGKEVGQTQDEHSKQTDNEILKQMPSADCSDSGDDGTPSKRRRSRRVAYLGSLVYGCKLCKRRFATENEYKAHLKERHNSFLNDYGEVVRLSRLENLIKRKRKSSQCSGTKSRKPRVQELRDESEPSGSPQNSPMMFDKEEEDPLYEPAASSDDDDDDDDNSPKPKAKIADVVVDAKKLQPDVIPPDVDPQIAKLPEGRTMRAWNCTICYLTFFKILDLKNHVMSTHLKPIVGGLAGFFLCPYCAKAFRTKMLVQKHIGYYHSLKELLEKHSKPNAVVPALSLMSCKICGQQFLGSLCLNDHMKRCHFERHQLQQYHCHLCKKSYRQMEILLNHIRSDHDESKVNATPPASFSSNHQLPSSKSNHSVQTKKTGTTEAARRFYYACAVCEEGFNREADLEDHIVSIHRLAIAPNRREKKPYGCLLCDKRFMQLNSITLHLVSYHKQDENDIMGGRRKEPEDDRRRTHQCLICLEYFSKKKFLDKHARRNNCRPSSQPKRQLPKRRAIVHNEGERPLNCPKCTGKYWGKAYLYLHVLEVHGNGVLGEFLLKKKIDDAAKEDFNDDTEEQEGPFPVAMYTAGNRPTGESSRRPLRGGFLPAGRIGKPDPVAVPASCSSAPVKIVPKENPSTPDVIDLTDDDPVEKEPIPKLKIIKRTPGNQVAPVGMGQQGRGHHHSNDRQQQPQRPGVPVNRNVGPDMVRRGVKMNRQGGGCPGGQLNRQVQQGAVRPPGASSMGERQAPTASQNVRQRLNQQIVRRENPAIGQNHASNQVAGPGSSAGQPRPGSSHAMSSQARPVSSTAGGLPRSVTHLSSTPNLPPRERISSQPRLIPSGVQRPGQPPVKNTTGPKITAIVDLTEDSDDEIEEPTRILQNENTIKCIHCPKMFTEPLQMLIHVYSDHVKHNPYVCAFCEETITDSQALQDHIKTHEQFKIIKSIIGSKDGLKLPFVIEEETAPEVIVL